MRKCNLQGVMSGKKRGRDAAEDGGGARPRYSRLDAETLGYYSEIDTHFKSLTDDEEKQLLADNALGETAGREAAVATDAACSRVLEALLPFASTEALCTFTRACVEGENLGAMCIRWGCRCCCRRYRRRVCCLLACARAQA